jgi:hypothetical protein
MSAAPHRILEDDASQVVDEYWQGAAANLASRQIRLVFVADAIPPELQRIIEFLNENLVRAECLRSRSSSTSGKAARRSWPASSVGRLPRRT